MEDIHQTPDQPEEPIDFDAPAEEAGLDSDASIGADMLNAGDDDTENIDDEFDDEVDQLPPNDAGDVPALPPRITVNERTPFLERPLYGVLVNPDGTSERIDVPPRLVGAQLRVASNAQRRLNQEFHSDQTDMDIAGADAYLGGLGIKATGVTFELPVEQRSAVFSALRDSRIHVENREAGLQAMYVPAVDAVFTFRGRAELFNGPGISEKDRIHELVHSNGSYSQRLTFDGATIEITNAHMGYAFEKLDGETVNRFLDEGVPDYVAGKWVAEVKGKPGGVAELPEEQWAVKRYSSTRQLIIPSRYVHMVSETEIDAPAAAFAATAIGHLIDRDAQLEPALIAGNRDPDAHEEVIGRLNAIHPGMYGTLRNTFNDSHHFEDGLDYVRSVLDIDD